MFLFFQSPIPLFLVLALLLEDPLLAPPHNLATMEGVML